MATTIIIWRTFLMIDDRHNCWYSNYLIVVKPESLQSVTVESVRLQLNAAIQINKQFTISSLFERGYYFIFLFCHMLSSFLTLISDDELSTWRAEKKTSGLTTLSGTCYLFNHCWKAVTTDLYSAGFCYCAWRRTPYRLRDIVCIVCTVKTVMNLDNTDLCLRHNGVIWR